MTEKTKQAYPDSKVMTISAITGERINAWLDEVIRRNDAGNKFVEVDYDIYAHGEAVLGRLNGIVALDGETTDRDKFIVTFMNDLCSRLEKEALPIGHVKAIPEHRCNAIIVNFTDEKEAMTVHGAAGVGDQCKLIINARVETTPDHLEGFVDDVVFPIEVNVAGGYLCILHQVQNRRMGLCR